MGRGSSARSLLRLSQASFFSDHRWPADSSLPMRPIANCMSATMIFIRWFLALLRTTACSTPRANPRSLTFQRYSARTWRQFYRARSNAYASHSGRKLGSSFSGPQATTSQGFLQVSYQLSGVMEIISGRRSAAHPSDKQTSKLTRGPKPRSCTWHIRATGWK